MFTGIITDLGYIDSIENKGNQIRDIRISSSYQAETIDIGASIACGGPCLTVVQREPRPDEGCWFTVTAAQETLERTTVKNWKKGDRINLERSLKIGDELGGHLVTGHVDGVARIVEKEQLTEADTSWGATARFFIEVPDHLSRFIAEKGSVTLDGTSLTVNSVEGNIFSVLLIPHTLQVTSWGLREKGDILNIEIDLMARYAERLAQTSKAHS